MKLVFIKIKLTGSTGGSMVLYHTGEVKHGMTIKDYLDSYVQTMKQSAWKKVSANRELQTTEKNGRKLFVYTFTVETHITVTMTAQFVPAMHYYTLKEYL